MNKQLLIDTQPFKIHSGLLTENINESTGNPIVQGILATCEVKNGNGRYYKRELWEREMAKYDEEIQNRRALGELDHPESQVVNLKNASHLITEWWWDGNNIMGNIEILSTPSGNILRELIKNGITCGVSSRGMGSLEQSGEVMEVQDDFSLLCWDFVSTPSNAGSYMNVIKESQTPQLYQYQKLNQIITEILCNKGSCPI